MLKNRTRRIGKVDANEIQKAISIVKNIDADHELKKSIVKLKENQIEIRDYLIMGRDIYSLAMYGFYKDQKDK